MTVDFRLKLLYGREGTKKLRTLYPQIPKCLLIRHGDNLLAHASVDYERLMKPVIRTLQKQRQDFEDQHLKRYFREYAQIAQPEMVIKFVKEEQERNYRYLLNAFYQDRLYCLVRALGMRAFLDRSFRGDALIQRNIKTIIALFPFKQFSFVYKRYLASILSKLRKCSAGQSKLDDLHNFQWYFETIVCLVENALLHCPEALKSMGGEAEVACQSVIYYMRALQLYQSNQETYDRLFLARMYFHRHQPEN